MFKHIVVFSVYIFRYRTDILNKTYVTLSYYDIYKRDNENKGFYNPIVKRLLKWRVKNLLIIYIHMYMLICMLKGLEVKG